MVRVGLSPLPTSTTSTGLPKAYENSICTSRSGQGAFLRLLQELRLHLRVLDNGPGVGFAVRGALIADALGASRQDCPIALVETPRHLFFL